MGWPSQSFGCAQSAARPANRIGQLGHIRRKASRCTNPRIAGHSLALGGGRCSATTSVVGVCAGQHRCGVERSPACSCTQPVSIRTLNPYLRVQRWRCRLCMPRCGERAIEPVPHDVGAGPFGALGRSQNRPATPRTTETPHQPGIAADRCLRSTRRSPPRGATKRRTVFHGWAGDGPNSAVQSAVSRPISGDGCQAGLALLPVPAADRSEAVASQAIHLGVPPE